jgi:hypothetical protein
VRVGRGGIGGDRAGERGREGVLHANKFSPFHPKK